MRETRRVLRMLEKRLSEINGQAEMLDQERRRLETAIEVVRDIEQEAGEVTHERGEVRAAVRQRLNRNGPQTRAEIVTATGANRAAVDGALQRLVHANEIARNGRVYHVCQPALPADNTRWASASSGAV